MIIIHDSGFKNKKILGLEISEMWRNRVQEVLYVWDVFLESTTLSETTEIEMYFPTEITPRCSITSRLAPQLMVNELVTCLIIILHIYA